MSIRKNLVFIIFHQLPFSSTACQCQKLTVHQSNQFQRGLPNTNSKNNRKETYRDFWHFLNKSCFLDLSSVDEAEGEHKEGNTDLSQWAVGHLSTKQLPFSHQNLSVMKGNDLTRQTKKHTILVHSPIHPVLYKSTFVISDYKKDLLVFVDFPSPT